MLSDSLFAFLKQYCIKNKCRERINCNKVYKKLIVQCDTSINSNIISFAFTDLSGVNFLSNKLDSGIS